MAETWDVINFLGLLLPYPIAAEFELLESTPVLSIEPLAVLGNYGAANI